MTNWYKPFMSIAFFLLSLNSVFGQIYVHSTATGSNNGNSWTNAYTDLNVALQAASSGDEIWVAKGIYRPTSCSSCSDSDKSIAFSIPSGVEVLGGFPDTGNPGIASRNWQTNTTILSGDIDGDGTSANNSFTIVRTVNVNNQTILDGFTIRDGNASNTSIGQGGGYGGAWFNQATLSMVSHPIVRNCLFTANEAYDGGAIYNNSLGNFGTQTGSDANMDIINCTFTNNFAVNQGGAIYNDADFYGRHTGLYQDNVFMGNSSSSDGGAILNKASINGTINLTIEGSDFSNNVTNVGSGGAIYNIGNNDGTINLLVDGSSFSDNTASAMYGGAVGSFMNGGILLDATIVNSTFRNNISMAGGAFYSLGANSGNTQYNFVNSVFYKNIGSIGGAIYFNESNGANVEGFISNSIFKENMAPVFDPIFHYSGSPQLSIEHSIVFDVADCNNLLLGTGTFLCGSGMQYLTDPLFIDENNGNFNIATNSPAINAGLNSAIPTGITQDFAGNTRISSASSPAIVDIGAYEVPNGASSGSIITMSCPANISITAAAGASTAVATWTAPVPTTTCTTGTATATLTSSIPSGGSFPIGTSTVTYSATDGCGSSTSCSFLVTVTAGSTGSPITMNCPANINATTAVGASTAVVTWTAPSAATTCTAGGTTTTGTGTVCAGEAVAGYNYLGSHNGSHYYLSDTQVLPSNIQSQNIPANIFGGYLASINTAAENEFVRSAARVYTQGSILIGLEYNHTTSTSSWASGEVFSYDNYASISTNPNQTYGLMQTWLTGEWVLNGDQGQFYVVEVPCGGGTTPAVPTVQQISGPASGSNLPIGNTTITYEAVDACGNATTCSFQVTVTAGVVATPITMNCPANINLTAAVGTSSAAASWTVPSATTTCTAGGGTTTGIYCAGETVTGYTYIGNYNGSHYYFSQNSANPADAQNAASTQFGGYLASINSAAENEFIRAAVETAGYVLIGLQYDHATSTSSWASGEAFTYSNYASISTDPNRQFGLMRTWVTSSGEWELDVSNGKPYVVEVPCGIPTPPTVQQTAGPASGSNFPVGTTTITYEATDACNNVEICSFDVTVTAASSTISMNCPANITLTTAAGASTAVATWTDPVPTTNCTTGTATATLTSSIPSGGNFPIGTSTVTYTATDGCGSTTTCSFDVIVTAGTSNISMTCPSNISLTAAAGASSAVATWTDPVPTTDCTTGTATATLTSSIPSGGSFPIGTSTVTYTATDGCGSTTTCSFDVIVTASTASVVSMTCPATINLTTAGGASTAVATWTAPTATTTCTTGGGGGGTCAGAAIAGYDYIGNHNGSDYYISQSTAAWTTAEQIASLPTAQGGAGGHLVVINDAAENAFIQAALGTNIVHIGLEYNNGYSWVNGDPVTYNNFSGSPSSPSFGVMNFWDGSWGLEAGNNKLYIVEIACGGSTGGGATVTQSSGPASGSSFPIGTTTVTYTATDGCGGSTTCSFDVVVTAGASTISMTCPADINLTTAAGASSAVATWTDPVPTTDCTTGSATATLTSSIPSGGSFPIGTSTVTYTATDGCGSTTTCSFDVIVTAGTSNISMTCPSNISLTAAAGATSAVATWTDPVPTTDCTTGTATATLTSSIPSGGSFPIGTSTVTYTATDGCGSTTTCSFQVTVTASTGSTVSMTCPATINLTTSGGASTAVATWTAPTATTTCTTGGGGGGGTCTGAAIAGYDYIGNHNGSDYYISQSTAAWATAEQIAALPVTQGGAGGHLVAINDAAENDFIQAALGTNIVHIGLEYNNGYSWVNGDPVTFNNFSGSPSNPSFGVINFWDGSWGLEGGNNKLYVVEVPCGGGSGGGGATVTQSSGPASGSSFPIGTTTVTYTATDGCGGSTTCSFDVVVTAGASNISMTCPSDIILSTAGGASTAVATWMDPVPTTNCTTGTATATLTSSIPSGGNFPIGTSTVTYTATDGCGGSTTCSFDVIVTAGSSTISMTCPSNISLTAAAGASSAVATWAAPVPTTDCITGGATTTLTSSIPSGGSFPIGTSTVTYTATDGCGSTTSCSFQVTVQAASGGAISLTCPANISLTTAQGSGGIVATWTTPSATTTCTTGGGGTCNGAAINGYTYLGNFGSSDYYLSNATLPWTQANTQSIAAGGHLVYIESQAENDFILSQIGEVVFIGMTDENSEGTFTWADGSALSYDNTQSFTPNSSTNNYGVIYNWAPGRWGYESGNVWKKYLLEVPCGGGGGGNSTVTLNPSIPSGSVFPVGTTTVTYTATDACNNTTSCSFTVTVTETTSNCQALTDGGLIGNSESDCAPYTPTAINNLTSPSGGSGTIEYLWLSSTSGCPNSVGQQIPGETGASLTLGSISQTTYIVRWSRRVGCTSWMASNCVVKTAQNCGGPGPTNYCDANSQQPWEEWIANVSLADLNHPSSKSSAGYEDNTAMTANVIGGQSYQVSVTPDYSYTQRDENVYVWIDYNQNNDFSDPGELVFSTLAVGGAPGSAVAPASGNITVPTSAINGTTRMRVALKATASTDPCGTFVQGEVEDYSVSITGATQGLVANIDLEAYHFNDEIAILEYVSTSSEPAIYELERSNDNFNFESLGTSDGNQISDDHPAIGTNYYRIKQIFEDGTIVYSDTKELVFGSPATAITLYPNPASDQLFIRLDNLPSKNGTIVITNLLGQQMTQMDLQELEEQVITISLDNYQSGMYLMHLSIEDQEYIHTKTFVVEQY